MEMDVSQHRDDVIYFYFRSNHRFSPGKSGNVNMLEQLLNEIKKGDTTSPAVFAKRLNTTPQMVEAMLSTLERMGYLRALEGECHDGTCASCPVTGYCNSNHQKPRVLVMVEKPK